MDVLLLLGINICIFARDWDSIQRIFQVDQLMQMTFVPFYTDYKMLSNISLQWNDNNENTGVIMLAWCVILDCMPVICKRHKYNSVSACLCYSGWSHPVLRG